MNNRLVETELFYADGQTDRHEKTNSSFSKILRTRLQTDYEIIDITVSLVCLDICYIGDVMAFHYLTVLIS